MKKEESLKDLLLFDKSNVYLSLLFLHLRIPQLARGSKETSRSLASLDIPPTKEIKKRIYKEKKVTTR